MTSSSTCRRPPGWSGDDGLSRGSGSRQDAPGQGRAVEQLDAEVDAGRAPGRAAARSRAWRRTASRRGRSTRCRRTSGSTSATVTSRPSSALSEVTPASAMPHGHEAVVPRQVDVAVEREAVHGDAPADPDAERGDLALRAPLVGAQPDAAAAGHARGRDAEVGADPDQGLLDAAYVVDDLDVVGEPDDRVADQLAGAVEGDQAAAVDVDHGRAAGSAGRSPGAVRLPAVKTGGCSSSQTVSGVSPVDDPRVDLALDVPRGEVVDGVVAVPALAEDQVAHAGRAYPRANARRRRPAGRAASGASTPGRGRRARRCW